MKHIGTLLFFLMMVIVIYAATQKEVELFNVANQGNVKKVQELIAQGADVNVRDEEGLTPLHSARDPKIIHELIIANADVNAVAKDGTTPLFAALYQDNKIKAMYLLEAGALVNVKQTLRKGYDYTPLRWAAEEKDYEMVVALLKKGARISEFLISLLKKLHTVEVEYSDIIRLLELYREFKDKRDQLNTLGKDGVAEIHKAVLLNDPIKIDALVLAGASLNIVSIDGRTPLHMAVRMKFVNCVNKLIDLGADVNKVDNLGNTPLDLAYKNNQPQFIELLSKQGGITRTFTDILLCMNSLQNLTNALEQLNQQLNSFV